MDFNQSPGDINCSSSPWQHAQIPALAHTEHIYIDETPIHHAMFNSVLVMISNLLYFSLTVLSSSLVLCNSDSRLSMQTTVCSRFWCRSEFSSCNALRTEWSRIIQTLFRGVCIVCTRGNLWNEDCLFWKSVQEYKQGWSIWVGCFCIWCSHSFVLHSSQFPCLLCLSLTTSRCLR